MAGNRLERIGTIFTRTTGLLQTGAMRLDDKPIWYDVYAMHPPDREPRYDRDAPNIEIREIFYEEDIIRAKFQQARRNVGNYNLNDRRRKTQTQEFIDIYKNLKAEGPLDDEKIFEVALDQLKDKQKKEPSRDETVNLVEEFTKAETPRSYNVADFYKYSR